MNRAHRHISPTTIIIAGTLLIFSLVSVISRLNRINPGNEWDVLIFTQNWPLSVCYKWHTKSNGTCTLPKDNSTWTIHGIWPTKFGTKGPHFCDKSRPFNIEEIYGILPELESRWTAIETHKKKYLFWSHEWDKHGTCAAVLPSLSSEFKYFSQGITWNEQYNIRHILEKAGVYPRDQGYNANDIWNGIKDVLGKNPYISCYMKNGISYIDEVRMCFNKTLSLVDCDGIKQNNQLLDCPAGKQIFYLKTIPSKIRKHNLPTDHSLITVLKMVQLLDWITF